MRNKELPSFQTMGNYKELCQLGKKYLRKKYNQPAPYRIPSYPRRNYSSIEDERAVPSDIEVPPAQLPNQDGEISNTVTSENSVHEDSSTSSDDNTTDSDDDYETPRNFLRRWTAEGDEQRESERPSVRGRRNTDVIPTDEDEQKDYERSSGRGRHSTELREFSRSNDRGLF
jgi:hypothetical protein